MRLISPRRIGNVLLHIKLCPRLCTILALLTSKWGTERKPPKIQVFILKKKGWCTNNKIASK